MNRKLSLLLFSCLVMTAFGQDLFKIKFDGCNPDWYAMETDTIVARVSDEELVRVINSSLDEKMRKRINGSLYLQIWVNTDGSSFLTGFTNETNIATKKFNIKHFVDSALHWNSPLLFRVATVVKMDFIGGNEPVKISRFGKDPYLGWLDITNRHSAINMVGSKVRFPSTTNHPIVIEKNEKYAEWRLYDESNSLLPYHITRSVCLDSKGSLWCCTDHGIVKIVGNRWTIFDGSNAPFPVDSRGLIIDPGSMFVDKEDRVWVKICRSIYIYDGNDWITFEKLYPLLSQDSVTKSLESSFSSKIDRNGVIWFSTVTGLVKFSKDKLTLYTSRNSKLPSNIISDVYVDKNQIKWIGTDSGLVKVENDTWTVYTTHNSNLPCDQVSSINSDSLGNIWIGTCMNNQCGGLAKIDNSGKMTSYNTQNSKLPSISIWKIVVDKNVVWLCMHDGGLVRIEDDNWTIFNRRNSLVPSEEGIFDITIDKNGNKWIGAAKGLVYTNQK
jgi:streptogramin lyase